VLIRTANSGEVLPIHLLCNVVQLGSVRHWQCEREHTHSPKTTTMDNHPIVSNTTRTDI